MSQRPPRRHSAVREERREVTDAGSFRADVREAIPQRVFVSIPISIYLHLNPLCGSREKLRLHKEHLTVKKFSNLEEQRDAAELYLIGLETSIVCCSSLPRLPPPPSLPPSHSLLPSIFLFPSLRGAEIRTPPTRQRRREWPERQERRERPGTGQGPGDRCCCHHGEGH